MLTKWLYRYKIRHRAAVMWYAGPNISDFCTKHISFFDDQGRGPIAEEWARKFKKPASVVRRIEKHGLAFTHEWIRMPSLKLWEAAGPFISQYYPHAWKNILELAATYGNIQPFIYCSKDALAQFVDRDPDHFYQDVHPDIWTWLIGNGLFTENERQATINEQLYPLKHYAILQVITFPASLPWIIDMHVKILRDYDLNREQKIRVVGQAMHDFRLREPDMWPHIEKACKPFLDDIDVESLGVICLGEPSGINAFHEALYFKARELGGHASEEAPVCTHQGLNLLMELTPPKNKYELYILSEKARLFDNQPAQAFLAPLAIELPEML